jgi:hypothetical protein
MPYEKPSNTNIVMEVHLNWNSAYTCLVRKTGRDTATDWRCVVTLCNNLPLFNEKKVDGPQYLEVAVSQDMPF